jgi:hypothetical protein
VLVLLWVEPVSKRSQNRGYYIQRGQEGVTRQPHPGVPSTWEGSIQIGNAKYPPCQGDTFNIIATLAHANDAAQLQNGPQTQPNPTGLHQNLGYAEADNLPVSGVPAC